MRATPPIGSDGVDATDWFDDPQLAWWRCRCAAIQTARRLTETADLPIMTEHSTRIVDTDEGTVLAEVEGDSEEWLLVPSELVLDAEKNR